MPKKLLYLINSLLILFCLISLFGGLVYRLYYLNPAGIIISSGLALVFFSFIQYFYLISRKNTRLTDEKTGQENILSAPLVIRFLAVAAYFIALIFCFYLLYSHRTANSIISPWQVTPNYFFLVYGLATLLLLGNIIVNKKIALFLIMLHYFLSFAVALIVYKLGYGYDPFIHRATENLIAQTGAVFPKPFYYLGQYGLVVILHKITALPVAIIDNLLLPLLAAISLPLALWQTLKTWFNSERLNLIIILSLLALTFPFLIVTTPQNLAYLLLLLVILLGLSCKNLYDYLIILLISFTAAITQPIAGLGALLFAALLALYHSDKITIKKYLYPLLVVTTVLILPALFYVLDKKISSSAPDDAISQGLNLLSLSLPGRENFILNFIYLYSFNFKFIFILLAAGGMIIAWKSREQCKILSIYLLMTLCLFASYLITVKIPFAFLIDYERSDYPERILLTASLFLLPFIILLFYAVLEKIMARNIFIKLSFAAWLTMFIVAAVYLSYPRFDNYFNSRGYSVSGADIKAASWINQDAKDDYIVLANQQVSAAALSQFGFKKYYPTAGDISNLIFYYPIPTASPLYRYYLDMVYKKPDRETIFKAMALAGVKEGYFVLNKYWWAFPKVLEEAKLSALSWQDIGNGQVYVFKYIRR